MRRLILLLALIFTLNSTFQIKALRAADGSCASLLGLLSSEDRPSHEQLSAYLKELFENGVITDHEIEDFRDALLRGERINPIKNAEMSIDRLVAYERIEALLNDIENPSSLTDSVDRILDQNQASQIIQKETHKEITGLIFRIKTAETDQEQIDIIEEYFMTPASILRPDLLQWALEHYNFSIRARLNETLSLEGWSKYPEILKYTLETTPIEIFPELVHHVFTKEEWTNSPDLFKYAILRITSEAEFIYPINEIFSEDLWNSRPDLLRLAIENTKNEAASQWSAETFKNDFWSKNHPELYEMAILKTPPTHAAFHRYILGAPQWIERTDLIKVAFSKTQSASLQQWADFFESPISVRRADFFRHFLEKVNLTTQLSTQIRRAALEMSFWREHPDHPVFIEAISILNLKQRRAFLKAKLGKSTW